MTLSLQPISIADDLSEERGLLIYDDAALVAVLACLDAPYYGDEQGSWHVEIGFGRCATRPMAFPTLDAALRWIAGRLGTNAEDGTICARNYLRNA